MLVFDVLLLLVALIAQKKAVLSFDKDNSAFLKAILPFFIILSHSHAVNGIEHGTYYVGLFFFISGYGLEVKRLGSSKLNWGGRILKIVIPFIVPLLLYTVVRVFTTGVSIEDVVNSIRHYELFLPYSWYLLSLLQLYLIFFLVSKFSSSKFIYFIPIVITAYIVLLYCLRVESTFYSSIYGFLAGILFCHLLPRLSKKTGWLLASIAILVLSFYIYVKQPPLEMLYNLWLFVIPVAVILSFVVTKNKVIHYFSSISYEVYLCQGIAFIFARLITSNSWIVFVLASIFSIVIAIISKQITHLLLQDRT